MKETKKEKKKGEGIRAHVVFNWDVRVYCDEGRGRDEWSSEFEGMDSVGDVEQMDSRNRMGCNLRKLINIYQRC